MFDEILIPCGRTLCTLSTALLRTVLCEVCPLYVAEVRYGDYHIIIGVEILWGELFGIRHYLGASSVIVLFFYLYEFVFYHPVLHAFVYQQAL